MMKRISLFAVCAALALSVAFAGQPAAADDQPSVTKSKRYKHRSQTSATAEPYRSRDFVGSTCAYDRAAGRCMIDLGYGRCMECSAGPFK
jgi:hypothetical protein